MSRVIGLANFEIPCIELAEAIASTFRWHREVDVLYVLAAGLAEVNGGLQLINCSRGPKGTPEPELASAN